MPQSSPSLVMVVPTFNEAANLPRLIAGIHEHVPQAHVLVVDDNSPDGTGAQADSIAASDDRVSVLHRTVKEGLGRAYLAGFALALERGYDLIGEMDADLSHQPRQLPLLVDAIDGADLVIGARWIPGGSVKNWPLSRELLSRGGNLYIRMLLGVPLRDATAGFRLFRRTTLEAINIENVTSTGYVFQADLAFRVLQAGLKVIEVPIEFVERERGESKMTANVASESLKRITVWGLQQRAGQLSSLLGRGER